MPGRRVTRRKVNQSRDYAFTKKEFSDDPWSVLEKTLKSVVNYGNYDYRKSIIPLYDTIYKYLDDLQKSRDYSKNTGRTPAYGSSSYTFGSASDLANGFTKTSKDVVYAVGNLAKRF